MINQKQIILFDGVCNFCNFWVNFVIKRDKIDLFRFAAFQTPKGKELFEKYNLDFSSLDTVVLITEDKIFTKSTAVLMICKNLPGLVKIIYSIWIIPRFIRDYVYDLIAKNRYLIFGKRETCRVPTEDEKKKFLD